MRITVEIRRPRWLTSARLRRARPLVLLLALVLAGPVLASDPFIDVPSTNPHHDDINTIAVAGVTRGCNPPTNNLYCPADPVRRDQMASFLQRGLGRGSYNETAGVALDAVSTDTVAQTDLTVPGAGFVLVNAAAMAYVGSGCPCDVGLRLDNADTGEGSFFYADTLTNARVALSNTYVFSVGSAGTYTFQANMFLFAGTSASADASISAVWVPFGSSGSSTLGVTQKGTQKLPD